MSENTFNIGDTVYLFETDPNCETIYEITDLQEDGLVKLYHPVKLEVKAYNCEIKHSIL